MSLSALLHPKSANHKLSDDSVSVRLRFFELVGKRCVDLIAPKAGTELKLMNDGNDAVRPAGAAEPIVEGNLLCACESIPSFPLSLVQFYCLLVLVLVVVFCNSCSSFCSSFKKQSNLLDAAHLLSLLKLGKKRRATAPTDVNGGSSRSHAVCQIVVDRADHTRSSGLLTLVDCAGSERKEDSMYHDKERQKESTEINASL
jgi:hypothetical protein